MQNINNMIEIIVICIFITILLAVIYILYMCSKKKQHPKVNFSRFKQVNNDVNSLEKIVNGAIDGVNGWIWLSMSFLVLHYILNFWSLALLILNLVIVVYEEKADNEIMVVLVAISLLFSFIDLWINCKEKSEKFHKQWFITSNITKYYLVRFIIADTFVELCKEVEEYIQNITKANEDIKFL